MGNGTKEVNEAFDRIEERAKRAAETFERNEEVELSRVRIDVLSECLADAHADIARERLRGDRTEEKLAGTRAALVAEERARKEAGEKLGRVEQGVAEERATLADVITAAGQFRQIVRDVTSGRERSVLYSIGGSSAAVAIVTAAKLAELEAQSARLVEESVLLNRQNESLQVALGEALKIEKLGRATLFDAAEAMTLTGKPSFYTHPETGKRYRLVEVRKPTKVTKRKARK